ncbi:MAG TPA: T9SS type A sorting domain-containing protein [Saprospiraceae bacterium]|nr:T9SS type A sorting domain-containing protein [Saprospiraceae bacterium]
MNRTFTLSQLLILFLFSVTLTAQDTRAIDGTGNNVNHPTWGAYDSPLLTPSGLDFSDGVSEPSGISRPTPRNVSNALFAQDGRSLESPLDLSDFCWAFGQLMDHDIVLVGENEETLVIEVPQCDEFFDPLCAGTAVIPIHRTVFDPNSGTSPDNPRLYRNEITHWMDASFLYGSTPERNHWLRTFNGGRLKTSHGDLLPYNTFSGEFNSPIDFDAPGMAFVSHTPGPHKYFVAGDVRANENILLTALQTLFLREHNRLADSIALEYPQWNDEKIYQKARRLVIGLMEHIAYDEWLPEVGIFLPAYQGYNPDVNPNMSNLFSVASFRIGHTIVGEDFWRLDEKGDTIPQGNIELKDAYFQSSRLINEAGLDPIFRGMAAHRQQAFDAKLVDDLRNRLFGDPGQGGLDLVSVNILRGRERGVPDLNTVREAYGLPKYSRYSEITQDVQKQAKIKALYWDIDDIDPWVGMLLEDRIPNKMMGETMHATLYRQFQRLRDGDRFFYLNDPELSQTEINWINNTMLSDLVMRNSNVKLMQRELIVAMPREQIVKEHIDMAEDVLSSYALPNPVPKEESLHLVIGSPETMAADISLLDFSGRQLFTQAITLNKGKTVHTINLASYPSGIYLVKVTSGNEQTIERVLKE